MRRNDHLAQLLVLANASLGALTTARQAYTPRKAAQSGDTDYVQTILTRRYGGNLREGGPISPSGWRVTFRAVGTSDENVRVMLDAVEQGVEDHTITVDGVVSTPIAFENEDSVRQDADDTNIWSGLTSWTYAF